MSMLIKEKGFYKVILSIAIPIALQNLISYGINMMDTIMLGALGETQLSAASLANQPFFIFTIITFGIASGCSVLTSQYWGKGDKEPIRRIIGIALDVTIVLSLLLFVLLYFFPETAMRIYTNEADVIAAGVQYLKITSFTYLFFGFTNTMICVFRSVEIVKISVIIYSSSFFVNVFFNYVLIFGKFGFPALGIRGAAIATLTARIFEFCVLCVYLFFVDKRIQFRPRNLLVKDKVLAKDFALNSTPVVLNEAMWSVGTSVHSMILGRMGQDAVAASSISGVVQQLAMVLIIGLGSATAVVIGKAVGASQYERARQSARTLQMIAVGVGALSFAIVMLIKDPIVGFYNISATTRAMTNELMIASAVLVAFQALTYTNLIGVLRGGGDTRFVLLIDVIFLWFVGVPLGAVAGLWLKLPVVVVFLCLKSDEFIKFFIGIFRVKSGRWINNLTR
ncbi:MATE family efflux transporter [Zongyangia hominis]|uniref:MATE family efflux transporter n=1 Tax=Zongyangia hominis TaxID=2763677 RepID=A0A926E948_9FIRM|nr:MATE family efflux transporter [Zongyangia hominis]MBC8570185.1 MATE family efflux transporter [Zongyangia hominis]